MPDNHSLAAVVIFGVTYALISVQEIRFLNLDRPSAAMLNSVLMVSSGVLTLSEAYASISGETLHSSSGSGL